MDTVLGERKEKSGVVAGKEQGEGEAGLGDNWWGGAGTQHPGLLWPPVQRTLLHASTLAPPGGPPGSLRTPLPDSLQEPLVDVWGSHAPKLFRGKFFFFLVFVECDTSIRSTERVEGATGQPRGWKGRKRETEKEGPVNRPRGRNHARLQDPPGRRE